MTASWQRGESDGEVETLESQIAKLRKEIANLAEAVVLAALIPHNATQRSVHKVHEAILSRDSGDE